MSDIYSKYRKLVEVLHERTTRKTIKWRYDSSDQTVWVRLAGQMVIMKMSSNNDFEPLCSLQIANTEGELLEGFNDENLGPEKPTRGSFANWFGIMEATFEMAKRQATGADEALDNILKELTESNPFDDVDF